MEKIFIPQSEMLEAQIRSMRLSAPYALDYHYSNYCTAHKGIRFDWKEGERIDTHDHIQRLQTVRLELIAYLNWLGRIYHFVESMKEKGWSHLTLSDDFKIFRDKWASHRSADYPRGEDNFLHYQILLNLDTSQTFNSRGEYEPQLSIEEGKVLRFNLFQRHSHIKRDLEKIFSELGIIPTDTHT